MRTHKFDNLQKEIIAIFGVLICYLILVGAIYDHFRKSKKIMTLLRSYDEKHACDHLRKSKKLMILFPASN